MNKIYFLLLVFAATLFVSPQTATSQNIHGYALYNALNSRTTYLIDSNEQIAKTWNCTDACNYTVLLMPSGNLMRGAINTSNSIRGAAVGGKVQEIDPTGSVVWEFIYSSATVVQHHDITLLPSGNVLLTAWERKDQTEIQAAGFQANWTYIYSPHFIEVEQDGTGGKIVWEWHMWDHLIQDVDNTKPSFGVVKDNPQLMDINVNTTATRSGDWLHTNGLHYNDSLDQIAFSSRFLSEIFIIDHSTTTAEAASHAGGNSGKGGDLLYRWGNPSNWGGPGAKQIYGPVHDVRWIKSGRPNAGYLQFFNNQGINNSGSTVDAINPPLVGYNYTLDPVTGYAPLVRDWTHQCLTNAAGQSASNRMSNGNVFVNLSGSYMYEVNPAGSTVFQYSARSAKGFRYECDYPGLIALLGNNPCGGNVGEELLDLDIVKVFPNPSDGIYEISGMRYGYTVTDISVYDMKGNVVRNYPSYSKIDIADQAEGIYIVNIKFDNGQLFTQKVSLKKN